MNEIKLDTRILDAIIANTGKNADQVLGGIAYELEADVKSSMKEGGTGKAHVPSEPGNPPNVEYSTLKNSIHTVHVKPKLWRVQDGVEYGLPLEMGSGRIAARPFMIPGVERIRKNLDKWWRQLVK
jgi:hypothetical protein